MEQKQLSGGPHLFVRWGPPILILILFLLFTVAINQVDKTELVNRAGQTFEKGIVTEIVQDNLQIDGSRLGEQVVKIKMLTGVRQGQELETTSSAGYLFGAPCRVGMKVVVMQSVAGDTTISSVYAQSHEWVIYLFAALYLAVLCLVGGLLFSGLLISSLGAVMDVAMSISSAISEICDQNPALSKKELFRSGMRVGRDMMGTDSNTLILAFAGSNISMLVLDYAYNLPYQQIINSNNIGIAIMQGLSGSFGIVLSVPVTVLLAALLFKRSAKGCPSLSSPSFSSTR